MNFALVLKQAKTDTVDGSIAPSLVEEAARSIQVIEVVLVRFASPKVHIRNLKVAPEMTCRVALSPLVMRWASFRVGKPVESIVGMEVLRVISEEPDRFRPQSGQCFGFIVQRNGEAIRLVVILHVSKNVVVDIAKEMNFGLDAPIPLGVLKSRMLVEETSVPSAHLMI